MKRLNKNSRVIGNELRYLKKVLKNNFRASKSTEFVQKLELKFAKKFNSKFAISSSDGTSALSFGGRLVNNSISQTNDYIPRNMKNADSYITTSGVKFIN